MTERHHAAKSARHLRSSRVLGLQQGLLLAACAAGSLIAIQACSSSSSGGGSAGASNGAAGTSAGGGGPSTAGTGALATAGASNGTAGGAVVSGGAPGTAGAQGTAGTGTGTAGAGGTAAQSDDVLERNHHASRDGLFIQPKLTKAAIATMAADTAFAANFTGSMWASPLYISNGPGGKGAFFAVTTGNDVFAIDETSGATLWTKNIGSTPMQSGAGCGSIHPIGILSTPVIDATKRVIYVAGAIGTDTITRHEIHAINIDTGMEVTGWPVDLTGTKSGSATFSPMPQNQRSALSLVNGTLYVAYGGHVGDCGAYRGWVVAVNTTDPTQRGAWATLDTQGAGIWAAGGMASDGTSIFAVTGNHTPFGQHASDRSTSDSEQVTRLTGMAVLDKKDANVFFPTTWKTMDDNDADMGASNPVYFSVPGATPANYVGAVAKDGNLYLLNATNLGGMGGAVTTIAVATGNMAVKSAPTVYQTAEGTHITFSTDSNATCPAGGGGGAGQKIVSVLLKSGSPPTGTVDWCASQTGEVTAPISTTSDGMADPVVWYMSGNKLTAVDGDSGASLFTSSNACMGPRRWSSPIAVKGRIVVGGDANLCSWSVK